MFFSDIVQIKLINYIGHTCKIFYVLNYIEMSCKRVWGSPMKKNGKDWKLSRGGYGDGDYKNILKKKEKTEFYYV